MGQPQLAKKSAPALARIAAPASSPSAAAFAAGPLASLGHEAVRLPLSKAEHDVAAVKAALTKPHAAIAITSAEAARLLAGIGENLAPHRQTPLFAVGEASAEAARRAGFRTVVAGGGDGESLAETILAQILKLQL